MKGVRKIDSTPIISLPRTSSPSTDSFYQNWIYLLLCVLIGGCSSPQVYQRSKLDENNRFTTSHYELSNVIIFNKSSEIVYRGTIEVHENKIVTKTSIADPIHIPDSEIHKIFGLYRGGGLAMFLTATLFFMIVHANRPADPPCDDPEGCYSFSIVPNSALGVGVLGGILTLPLTGGGGSSFYNTDVILYDASKDTSYARNYFLMIDNVPASRNALRKERRQKTFSGR